MGDLVIGSLVRFTMGSSYRSPHPLEEGLGLVLAEVEDGIGGQNYVRVFFPACEGGMMVIPVEWCEMICENPSSTVVELNDGIR
jgi:hypothetical protein